MAASVTGVHFFPRLKWPPSRRAQPVILWFLRRLLTPSCRSLSSICTVSILFVAQCALPSSPTLSLTPSQPLLLPFSLPRPPTAVSLLSFHADGRSESSSRLLQMLKETNLSGGRGLSALRSRAEREAEPLCRNDSSSSGVAPTSTRGQSTHTTLCAIPAGQLHTGLDLGLFGSFL